MSKVYRATAGDTFQTCPMKWYLKKEGWLPNAVGMLEVASCLGTAFHAGAAVYVLDLGNIEAAQEAARASLIETAGAIYNSGRVIRPSVEADLDALPQRVINAIKALHEGRSQLDPYEVVAAEQFLPAAGGTTTDLVLREKATGHVCILDWKCKTFSQPWYREQFISDFAQSWQLKHYCWGYEEETGEKVDTFLLGLMDVTNAKGKLRLYPYVVDDLDLEHWHTSAREAWSRMEAIENGELAPAQASQHRTQYGRCEYWDACFTHQYRGTMHNQYVQLRV